MQDLFIQRNDKIQMTCTQMNQPGQCNQKLLRQVLNRNLVIFMKMLSHTSMLS